MWRRPKQTRKVFFIGFNKCGTKSLHHLFAGAGYRSAHARIKRLDGRKDNLAVLFHDNIRDGRKVLQGCEGYDIFSDLTSLNRERIIEGNSLFRQFHSQNPDAYFVLNTRPVDDWIRSRSNHENPTIGSFLSRYMTATGMDRDSVIHSWYAQFEAHHAGVRSYFAQRGRFLEYDIRSDIGNLVQFVKPDYSLEVARWRQLGRTTDRIRH
jgi:hypothetical protein